MNLQGVFLLSIQCCVPLRCPGPTTWELWIREQNFTKSLEVIQINVIQFFIGSLFIFPVYKGLPSAEIASRSPKPEEKRGVVTLEHVYVVGRSVSMWQGV